MHTYANVVRKAIYFFIAVTLTFVLFPYGWAHATPTNSAPFREEKVTFVSGTGPFEEVINGTMLIPNGQAAMHPGIVLAHGSGTTERGGGSQTAVRKEAEVFANAGIATLLYNKRSKGYSKTNRSYELLAQDLIAGVQALQKRPDVIKSKVGVWGISEGGWVAPIAAAQSKEIAFVITSGGPGISPVQQQSWNLENRLRHQGVSAHSAIQSLVRNGAGVMLSLSPSETDMYDPVPTLKKVQQPFLAIWGSIDRQVPPAESAQIFKDAFESSGNRLYTLQFIEGADHPIYNSSDNGFRTLKTLYPGYAEAMTSWIKQVVAGNPPVAQTLGKTPIQMSLSSTEVKKIDWYDLYWLHLGVSAIVLISGISVWIALLVNKIRKRKTLIVNGYTRWASLTAIVSIISFWTYLVSFWMNGGRNIGFVLFGSPLIWLIIQLISTVTVILTLIALIVAIRRRGGQQRHGIETLALGAGLMFIPWAFYWHLCFFIS
ncbi:alpha/beta hydrolase family protein [Paenibacillus sp. 481]|uniref:alpha/beta hydrolase family protein n=1 Tax=Paenibacillus sp. 481 TaxID=2835869 RepID=UPI001E2DBDCA|nr:prolyl oligopeptidase family serine peptidase [Paenibacillus sp. 481]UHA73408.1 prolyl oligopeptidase family serine peptidase [Paenibacillus sp. 481]